VQRGNIPTPTAQKNQLLDWKQVTTHIGDSDKPKLV